MVELVTPRAGPGVCPRCFNFTREACGPCRACRTAPPLLSAMLPISYAEAGGPLHRDLADYKRAAEPAVPALHAEIAHLLSRFLAEHEACVASAAQIERLDIVTVVPSSDRRRDRLHPLRRIVAEQVPETAGRYARLLAVSDVRCVPHTYDPRRFTARTALRGENVLLIDDVWTTGATAQSAAAALRAAGAATVAAVVVGRYVNGFWGGIADRLQRLREHEDRDGCALCHPVAAPGSRQPGDGQGAAARVAAGP